MLGKPLWTCPKCGRQFATVNQWHACGEFTVERFLKGKSDESIALFHRFIEMVETCGEVRLAPAKTWIGFQVGMTFAAVNRLSSQGLFAHVILHRPIDSYRVYRIEEPYRGTFVNHFRIRVLDQLDDEVQSWLCEAYQVGAQVGLDAQSH